MKFEAVFYAHQIQKPTWIRHVVERVEILPYHTMGIYKYTELQIPYPLDGTPPLSAERKENAIRIFKQHISCPVI